MTKNAKLPVVGVFTEAVQFAARHWWTYVRAGLGSILTLAALLAPIFYVLSLIYPNLFGESGLFGDEIGADPFDDGGFFVFFGLMWFSIMLLYGLIIGQLTRFIVSGEKPPLLPLTPSSWRAAWMFVLSFMTMGFLFFLSWLGLFLPVVISGSTFAESEGTAGAGVLVYFLFYMVVFFYCAMRLFLFPTDAILNNRLRLLRSWRLTRWNFWRMVGLWFLTIVTVFTLSFLIQFIAVIVMLIVAFLSPLLMDGSFAIGSEWVSVAVETLLLFLFISIFLGVYFGMIGFAYSIPALPTKHWR